MSSDKFCGRSWQILARLSRDKSGAAVTEFALVLIPMVAIIFGIMMMGSLFFIHNDMMNAAREAARRMSVDETITFNDGVPIDCSGSVPSGGVAGVACNSLGSWPVDFIVTATATPLSAATNAHAEVKVAITADMAVAAIVDILGATDGKTMRANVIMRSEYLYSALGGGGG